MNCEQPFRDRNEILHQVGGCESGKSVRIVGDVIGKYHPHAAFRPTPLRLTP